MSTTTLTPAEQILEAQKARDEGMSIAQVADEERGSWDSKVIDQAIEAFAEQGRPFSMNDIRPLLPEVRPSLIGVRFTNASRRGYLRRVGMTPSLKRNTHLKPVALWLIANRTGEEA